MILMQLQFDNDTLLEVEDLAATSVSVGLAARVILFNDEEHTFDEVIVQIIRATGCSMDRAEALTLEVHHRGKAMVFEGAIDACMRVSAVLEEIELHTHIEF